MSDAPTSLYLITPAISEAEALAPLLREACGAASVAAVLLRLAGDDERSLINKVKLLAPIAQEAGAALVVSAPGDIDIATLAVRGGADGVHVAGDITLARRLRQSLKPDMAVGCGGLKARHDAMEAGEALVDYVLFGEPREDGSLPPMAAILDRAAWWAEIFQTPCVVYAPSLEDIAPLVATRAEFIAVGDAVWSHPSGAAEAVRLAAGQLITLDPVGR